MGSEQIDFKEYIYSSLLGLLTEPHSEVEDLFTEGKKCEMLYTKVYDACQRLYERLGNFEDEDVEIIVNAMSEIQKEVALKMYEYGAKFKKEA